MSQSQSVPNAIHSVLNNEEEKADIQARNVQPNLAAKDRSVYSLIRTTASAEITKDRAASLFRHIQRKKLDWLTDVTYESHLVLVLPVPNYQCPIVLSYYAGFLQQWGIAAVYLKQISCLKKREFSEQIRHIHDGVLVVTEQPIAEIAMDIWLTVN